MFQCFLHSMVDSQCCVIGGETAWPQLRNKSIVDFVSMFQFPGVCGKLVRMCDCATRRKSGSPVRMKTASCIGPMLSTPLGQAFGQSKGLNRLTCVQVVILARLQRFLSPDKSIGPVSCACKRKAVETYV